MLLIVCPLVFLGGFVDSIAGGGGLISLPAYMFAGLPVHFAYGTNKFSSCSGTLFSSIRFIKSRNIYYKSIAVSVVCAIAGSFIGARAALAMDEIYLKYCLMVLLPAIVVFMLFKRDFGEREKEVVLSDKKIMILSMIFTFIIGAYDGFFGPGAGTFLILVYTGVLGFNMTVASGNAKIINLASNISALVTFIAGGKVMLAVGLPAALCSILGHWIGSGLAIKNGAKVIRPVFLMVIIMLFIKVGLDLI